ncbi:MAG TPA: ABC transporter permease [Cyclobacteriaceae bacterium]|nr:ABC transporter permease [Cyclobacteriaceae bacterium]
MNKVLLVIRREYLSRVKKRSFLLATLITPLIFPAIMGVFLWISFSDDPGEASLRIIEVVDENNEFFLESTDNFAFAYTGLDVDDAKELARHGARYGFLHIPKIDLQNPKGIVYYSEEIPSLTLIGNLEATLKRKIEEMRLYDSGIDPEVISALKTDVSVQSVTLGTSGTEAVSNASVNYAIGFVTGILIYTFIFVYGNQIMQGVIEEKSSRIIEIIISSLKPFQLMMGKIIGIGAVGLTQFLIWILLITVVSSVVMGYFGLQMPQQQILDAANPESHMLGSSMEMNQLLQILMGIDYPELVASFVFYFLGGYLLYGAFFAAIGAAVDSPSDAQQFMFPVTIPLIIAYLGLFIFVLDDPNSNMSFWLSIVPFTSPIAMMGRISYGVPFSELALSIGLLVLGFLFTTWLAGKIYRIGILVHGTKVGYRTLWKWFRAS